MKKILWFFKIGLLFSIFFIVSCKSLDYAECTKVHHKELIIRWGESFKSGNKKVGFELNSKAELFKYENMNNKTTSYSKVGNVDQDRYCNILSMITKTILKTQVVNEIGDTLRYFEYINPAKNSDLYFKWHPRFNTKNSRGFQEIYDSLNILKLSLD